MKKAQDKIKDEIIQRFGEPNFIYRRYMYWYDLQIRAIKHKPEIWTIEMIKFENGEFKAYKPSEKRWVVPTIQNKLLEHYNNYIVENILLEETTKESIDG